MKINNIIIGIFVTFSILFSACKSDSSSDEHNKNNQPVNSPNSMNDAPLLNKYRINISRFGNGDIKDSEGKQVISATESVSIQSYDANTSIRFTATPKNGYTIDSWDGCNNVSLDLATCDVSLINDKTSIHVNFVTTTIDVVNNFIDISSANTKLLSDTSIKVTWSDDTVKTLISSVSIDDFIAGNEGEGFLKIVTDIDTQLDYVIFSVEDAALSDVISSGATIVQRDITIPLYTTNKSGTEIA